MKNFFKFLGIITLIAVIGFSMAACKNDDEEGGPDPALNGTWVSPVDSYGYITEIKLDNGSLEVLRRLGQSGRLTPYQKGTYTTSGSSMTIHITHYYYMEDWLTKDQLKSTVSGGVSDDTIDRLFESSTGIWSISGDTLTVTSTVEEQSQTYTRKN